MEPGSYRGFDYTLPAPGIALIAFNTPERLNGMTAATSRDLAETLLQLQMDPRVRVIVFTGSGRAFCAGDDISGRSVDYSGTTAIMPDLPHSERPIERIADLRFRSQHLIATVRSIDKPTIAAINGVAIQSGLSLALACDFRIAATGTRLGSATLRFGYQPDEGGQWLLVQLIGVAKTVDFLLRERIVAADEALELGLVHEVTSPEGLMDRAMELARELADGPQVAMRLLKRSIYTAAELTMQQAMEEIAVRTAISDYHDDAAEGGTAFREKREARFNRWLT